MTHAAPGTKYANDPTPPGAVKTFDGADVLFSPPKAPGEPALAASCIHFRPFLRNCITPVRVGDLIVVEQQLCGYELGEIAEIENVMARERKEYSVRDLSRITETTTTTTESEVEETESSKVDERFSLSTQSQEAQSQQTSISGNLSASYKAPAFSASISSSASYNTSKSSSYSASEEYAKDITTEATKRVREAVSESKSVTVVTESVKNSLHGFDNTKGDKHIRGIYRWVDKKYKAQLYDYGKRLFLEFMVPEPAFYLRDVNKLIEQQELAELVAPVHPRNRRNPIASHLDITEQNYAAVAAAYDVTDLSPPPPEVLLRGKSIAHPDQDPGTTDSTKGDHAEATLAKKIDSIVVEPGYHLTKFKIDIPLVEVFRPDKQGLNTTVKYGYYTTIGFSNATGDVNTLLVSILGTTAYYVTHNQGADNDKDILVNTDRFDTWWSVSGDDQVEGEVPITVGAEFEGKFYFAVQYRMERNAETLEQWQIETYSTILQGYLNKQREYDQKLKEAELARDALVSKIELQSREEAYREIEAAEFRKHCIDILTRHSAFSEIPRKLNQLSTGEMELNLNSFFGVPSWQAHNVSGVTAAFFEDSFEWEQITYKLYPYFWTDRSRWPTLFREAETGDAQFDQFLKSGFAKVVVPIRPNYERSVLYFLKTNLIWAGGAVPALSDETHLALIEELHESVQLEKGDGRPVGDPWEILLPTSLVYLQEDGILPEFDCSGSQLTEGSASGPPPPAAEEIIEELTESVTE